MRLELANPICTACLHVAPSGHAQCPSPRPVSNLLLPLETCHASRRRLLVSAVPAQRPWVTKRGGEATLRDRESKRLRYNDRPRTATERDSRLSESRPASSPPARGLRLQEETSAAIPTLPSQGYLQLVALESETEKKKTGHRCTTVTNRERRR